MPANDPFEPAIFTEALGKALYQYSIGSDAAYIRARLGSWYPHLGERFADQVMAVLAGSVQYADSLSDYEGPGTVGDILSGQHSIKVPVIYPGNILGVRANAIFEDDEGNVTQRSFASHLGSGLDVRDIGERVLLRAKLVYVDEDTPRGFRREGLTLVGVTIIGAYGAGQ